MVTYPQLKLPEAWKPFLIALQHAGWELSEVLEEQPEFAMRPVIAFENFDLPDQPRCYLTVIGEPVWCGNTIQSAGITIMALSDRLPGSRKEAEERSMPLMPGWEGDVEAFVEEAIGRFRQSRS